jgi:hypothetical protein
MTASAAMTGGEQPAKVAPLPLALRIGWGAALLIAPGTVLRLFGGADEGVAPRRIMRVLGARHVVQAAAERAGGRQAREIGTLVDLLHAGTSVGFGLANRRWRRAAWSDAAVTLVFVVLGATNP